MLIFTGDAQRSLLSDRCPWSISLDRKWMVAWDGGPVLIDVTGNLTEVKYWQDDWDLAGWLNPDEWLVTEEEVIVFDDGTRRHYYGKNLFLLNPFTGEWRPLPTDFPDVYPYQLASTIPELSLSVISYDPTLALATYIRLSDGATVLIDVETRRVLWERPGNLPFLGSWSPDGETLAMPVWIDHLPEILLIDRQGNETRLTHLGRDHASWMLQRDMINGMGWSPSGERILFFFYLSQDRLGVVDIQSRQTQVSCPPVSRIWSASWSPDGSMIALAVNRDRTSHTVILDLDSGRLHLLEENSYPSAWLSAP
jgi:WD40 repeat protein